MVPVSTAKGITSSTGYMDMYLGEVAADNLGISKLTSTKTTEDGSSATAVANGDFVVFDLFFKLTASDQTNGDKIYLTNNSAVTSQDTKGIENAARVAFVDEGNVAASSTVTAIQALKGATTSSVVLWEPNNDAHTQASINHAASVYHYDGLMNAGGTDFETGHKAQLTSTTVIPRYYGLKTAFANAALDTADTSLVTELEADLKTGTSGIPSSTYLEAFTLQDGVTKMRIYMWIEGQDVDCQDAASGSDLVYSLQFSLLTGA